MTTGVHERNVPYDEQAGSLRSLNHDDIYILEALFELFLFALIQNDTCFSICLILKYKDETKNGLPLQGFGGTLMC